MAQKVYLKSTKTGDEYLIVKQDKEKGIVKLKDKDGVTFEVEFNKEYLKKQGYVPVVKDE